MPHEGEQEHREDGGGQRGAPAEPGPLRQVGRLAARVAHQGDDGEGADRHEGVGDEVEEDRGDALRGGRDDARQDEPGVRDRGVGEQPLDVGLGDRDDRPAQHRDDGDAPHDRPPVPGEAGEHDVQQAEQRAERGDLGGGGHEAGDRGRGALVDVRGPHVERHGADLEQEPRQDHRAADEEQRVVAHGGGEGGVDLGDRAVDDARDGGVRDGARVAVEEGDPEEEERRGERAEQEVLHRGLLRHQPLAAGEGAEEVERQGEDFQRDEQGQQVVRRREDQHADGEEDEREDLGGGEPGPDRLLLAVAARDGAWPGRRRSRPGCRAGRGRAAARRR